MIYIDDEGVTNIEYGHGSIFGFATEVVCDNSNNTPEDIDNNSMNVDLYITHKLPIMKSIDWNQMSKLGLIERINREILHPLGLAISRDTETGISKKILVADDGFFEYDPEMKTTILNDTEVKYLLKTIVR